MSDQGGPAFPWNLTPGTGRPQPEGTEPEEPEGAEPPSAAPADPAPSAPPAGTPPAWTAAPPPAADAPSTPFAPTPAPVPPVAPLPPQPTAPAFPAGWPPADAPAAPPSAPVPPAAPPVAQVPPTGPFSSPAEPALPRPVWDEPRPAEPAPGYDPEATQAYMPAPPAEDDPLAALGLSSLAPAAVPDGPAAASFLPQAPAEPEPTTVLPTAESTGLDALFGAERFREVEELAPAERFREVEELAPAAAPSRRSAPRPDPEPGERAAIGRTQRILLIVAGSVVAVLALVVLYLVGTRLGGQAAPAPVPSSEVTGGAEPVALAEPGDHHWEALYGGECLDPFEDAWQDYYTVVDCADPHAGQLALRAPFPEAQPADGSPAVAYPGVDALQAEATELCAGPGVIDLARAASYTDLVVQPSFAATAEQWDDGQTGYACFVSRSSGEPLEGSIAAPQDEAEQGSED